MLTSITNSSCCDRCDKRSHEILPSWGEKKCHGPLVISVTSVRVGRASHVPRLCHSCFRDVTTQNYSVGGLHWAPGPGREQNAPMAPCSCLPHKLGQNSTDSKKRPNLNSFGFNYFEKRGRLPKPRPFMKRFRPAGLGGGGVPTNQPSFLTWSPFTQPPGSLNNTHVSTGPQERGKSGEPNLKSEKEKKSKIWNFNSKLDL